MNPVYQINSIKSSLIITFLVVIIFQLMIKIASRLQRFLSNPSKSFVSDKFMKQRDQAAEKVYITRQQKEAMKKLLEKLSQEKKQDLTKQGQFERRLDDILRRYRINNSSFAAEVINLHKTHG